MIRDLILLGIIMILIFDGCSIKYSINGEVSTFEIEALVVTSERKDDETV